MMKKLLLILMAIVSFSCKKEVKPTQIQLTTAQKIANANGISNWKNVTQIDFTFNVDKDSTHFERSWSWQPKSKQVTLITDKDTISYNRSNMDSTAMMADRGFINDKFWLLAPFQISWDKGTTITDTIVELAPISKVKLNKLTLTYTSDGGYTPGDAYDFYYDKNYIIKEWIFRQGNTTKPSMITTFENYQDYNGIKIAKDHKQNDSNWNLNFSNISIKMN
ncbi:hypothetical protein [uncultured Olleya sp.]|uniref:hypothetical protein n=1 Tax=Olleya sp. UBA1516 TaxID=1947013 RepID=UPI0032B0FA8A